jgi:hypothetical protein
MCFYFHKATTLFAGVRWFKEPRAFFAYSNAFLLVFNTFHDYLFMLGFLLVYTGIFGYVV